MAQINKPTDYFNTTLWTGTGASNAQTGVGHQPDLLWIKNRNSTQRHNLIDSVRGVTKRVSSNTTDAEATNANMLTSFDSDGFTLGTDADGYGTNTSSNTYAGWSWLAGGTASSNTDGSITSSVSANTTSGFSIVSYTGTGANATVGHSLGTTPSIILVKCRSNADNWLVYNGNSGGTKYLILNATNAEATQSNIWNDTDATSSVFSLGTSSAVNGSSRTYVAYCFAEKKGFSKFGSYTGNGNADGTFVYTGFKPAWVLWKRTDSATNAPWVLMDNKRSVDNPVDKYLFPNESSAEGTANVEDFLSNGFKFRIVDSTSNVSGASYIYMAFAAEPLVGQNGVPTCAR